jgi:ribosomal protein S18 acetylase RimI-like enzyme
VDELWLDAAFRGHGYGRAIMAVAEARAQERGCQYVLVKTWDFQARGFYERLGFHVVGELHDYPPGHSLYWMRKGLVGAPDA